MGSYSDLLIGASEYLDLTHDDKLILYDSSNEKLQNAFSKFVLLLSKLDAFNCTWHNQRELVSTCIRLNVLARRIKSLLAEGANHEF